MSPRQPCMPGPPFGPVAARTSRRTRVGRTSQDHLALGCEGVGERGIPVVEVAAEMLQHYQRQFGRAPEPSVSKPHPRRLDRLRLSRLVSCLRDYGMHSMYLSAGVSMRTGWRSV